jgi:hypothetical protein
VRPITGQQRRKQRHAGCQHKQCHPAKGEIHEQTEREQDGKNVDHSE